MPFRTLPTAIVLSLFLALGGCGEGEPTAWTTEPNRAAADVAAEAGYLAPPAVTQVAVATDGRLLLDGTAAPGARVRLAAPAGTPIFADADSAGRWQVNIAVGEPVRLYGLSMVTQGRAVQAEGYLLLASEGRAAQLRAGAGAVFLATGSREPRILAVDYDRDGGAVVSGVSAPGATLGLRVDRHPRGETKADARGRFAISLTEPLGPGGHALEVSGVGGEDVLSIDASRPGGVGPGPFSGQRTAYGWRVDWMTPGGGVQTTQIFERAA